MSFIPEHEAILYEKLSGKRVRCAVCQRSCLIEEGKTGFCFTRINFEGRLFTLSYGMVSTLTVAPIEIKPLYHFYPGSFWLSLGSLGCNFRCPGCQNWQVAHVRMTEKSKVYEKKEAEFLSPEEAIRLAETQKSLGLSFTYNEPTLWLEYTIDCSKIAHEHHLLTNYVTNGFITPEGLDEIGPYLDAFRVDLKCFSGNCYMKMAGFRDFSGILEVIKRAKYHWKMHVEIVTNVTPGFNDDEEQLRAMAEWIATQLGAETPWHLTRFIPHLKLSHLNPTPLKALDRARDIGINAGLNYVYIGNVPGHPAENTYCPGCGRILIARKHFGLDANYLVNGRCPDCGIIIQGRWA
ncbi:MAG: AmmeMemoRadiSam system radical SAM enzyme [Spirochaetota bacterium]